ncbi:uncharacterized protein LOC120634785 isoform X2 [Pararge aegeria]|uniref:uncharacterized protein LOC120634785 isoform X2 n=1 Tax=Pararge aegeria TaxID=116150 RepID=UPI0019D08FF6|nr:uncharacterized protein LOC120634785 isoform X2 [Pararge aegeria]
MVNVVIARIPQGAKLHKFMNFLKKAIFRCKKEMHVNYFRPENDGSKVLSFSTTFKKALKAKKTLDGFRYVFARVPYPLECWLENLEEDELECMPFNVNNEQPQWEDDREDRAEYQPPCKSRRYCRSPVKSRSPSLNHTNELNAIEAKIELMRKQRILLEEESKLLLEKRKLEYLQNMGSNDYGNLEKFEDICRRNEPDEISEFLRSDMSSKQAQNSVKPKLPGFVGPCNEIIGQMRMLIASHDEITLENRSLFFNLLRTTLKKRLAVILEGKVRLPMSDIINLYRLQHPISTDANLVSELCNTIQTSCWPQKRLRKRRYVKDFVGGQTAAAQTTPTEMQGVDVTAAVEDDSPVDGSQLIDLDEFVDMENDLENWNEDVGIAVADDKDTEGQRELLIM